MRLDATDLRYVTPDEFRVLTAVEMGSKNHEVVPTPLIAQLSSIRSGITSKCLGSLAKRGLVARVQGAKYEGFRLTYGGLDYLALRTFSCRKIPSVSAVGQKIGVGKESDIYLVKEDHGEERVLKIHRLGRISFRAIKAKRDYLVKRSSASWMYMSRLAAEKEFAFMKVLYQHGFPVPVPIDQARHCIVMSLIDSFPLRQVDHVDSPSDLYVTLIALILRLARSGLIHGDFNEFNILIQRKTGEAVLIDFPQMVSTRHENAEYFFNRDVNCIRKFFRKRFRYEAANWPTWRDVMAQEEENDAESSEVADKRVRLDLEVEASGFGRAMQRDLEDYMIEVQDMPESDSEEGESMDGAEEAEDDERESEEGDQERQDLKEGRTGAFNEEAGQEKISDRLEAVRISRALGNDDTNQPSHEPPDDLSDLEPESDSDSQASSTGPPATDFTTYIRERKVRPPRISAKHLGEKDGVQIIVARERARTERGGGLNKGVGAGKVKGHKWKSSEKYLVGKNSGW